MKKTKSVIIGLVAVFLMVNMVYAQEQSGYKQRGKGLKDYLAKELNLTQEQQQKLAENRKAQGEEMKKLHETIKEKQEKLQEELKSPAVTRAAVEPLVNEIKSLQVQLIDSRIGGIFAVKEILTPEQFAQFQSMSEKRQEKRKGRFENWREKKGSADKI
jgi:Spy/CpxP family protein refolding chaperone